jgi:hypothetical protein
MIVAPKQQYILKISVNRWYARSVSKLTRTGTNIDISKELILILKAFYIDIKMNTRTKAMVLRAAGLRVMGVSRAYRTSAVASFCSFHSLMCDVNLLSLFES